MNKTELKYRVHQNLDDNGVFYTNIDSDDSLQDCYDEICAVSGCVMKHAIIPLIPLLSFYDLKKFIPDYLAVVAVYSSTSGVWLSPSSKREIENMRLDWSRQSGSPLLFYPVNHRYIVVYPRPVQCSDRDILYIFYKASAPQLDNTVFPDEYTGSLIDCSTADLFEQQLEYSKAQSYFNTYMSNLTLLETWVKSNRHPDRLFMLDYEQPLGGFLRPY